MNCAAETASCVSRRAVRSGLTINPLRRGPTSARFARLAVAALGPGLHRILVRREMSSPWSNRPNCPSGTTPRAARAAANLRIGRLARSLSLASLGRTKVTRVVKQAGRFAPSIAATGERSKTTTAWLDWTRRAMSPRSIEARGRGGYRHGQIDLIPLAYPRKACARTCYGAGKDYCFAGDAPSGVDGAVSGAPRPALASGSGVSDSRAGAKPCCPADWSPDGLNCGWASAC